MPKPLASKLGTTQTGLVAQHDDHETMIMRTYQGQAGRQTEAASLPHHVALSV